MSDDEVRAAFAAAEEIRDPLDGLVERTSVDPAAPFRPQELQRLAELRQEDRAAFEAVRVALKESGFKRLTALDDAIDGVDRTSEDSDEKVRKQSDVLIELAREVGLFHSPDETGYADVNVDDHRETWPIRSKGFRRWLTRRFYLETDSAPNAEALNSALSVLEAQASFDGPTQDVYVRVANIGERIYLDLCNSTWQAIEICAG